MLTSDRSFSGTISSERPPVAVSSSGRGGCDLTIDGCVESHAGPGKKKMKRARSYWTDGKSGSFTEKHAHAMRKVCSCCGDVLGLKEQETHDRYKKVRVYADDEAKLSVPVLTNYIATITKAAVVPTVSVVRHAGD